jgi:hypothetical protein
MKGFFITSLDWAVWRHPCRCSKNILVLFYNLLLLDRKVLGQGCSGCNVLMFTFCLDCEEDKLFGMRDYFETLFCRDSSRNYLWNPVEMTPQSNNETTSSRLINNMTLPHIWPT